MLKPEVRKHVMALGELLYYANSRHEYGWAAQSSNPAKNGVYGHASNALRAIIREECGPAVADYAMDHINFGGDSSFGLDALNAVTEALEHFREEAVSQANE